jgi:hypothetical protein
LSFVNSKACHLIYNNFNLNFIYDIVCLCVCVCVFSLHRESPDMILRDKPLISEVVLSHPPTDVAMLLRRVTLPSYGAKMSSLSPLYLPTTLHHIASPLELNPEH